MDGCFPDWLKNRSAGRLGPGIDELIPYPVYQRPPLILSADNNNSPSGNVNDAFFDCASGRILNAVINTTIVKIEPRNAYDTITVCAWDSSNTINLRGCPIFFSMNRPGRMLIETPVGDNPEISFATARAFDVNDFSSYAMLIQIAGNLNVGAADAEAITQLIVPTPKTNRPFYLWFGDGIQGIAPQAANFTATWTVVGR
jgi:hypothetical protein